MKCEAILVKPLGETEIPTFGVCWHPEDKQKPCPNPATTTRKDWRWGNVGEPKLVEQKYHFCDRCAKAWDEMKAEAEAEARLS
jgi:hypothetical protein